MKKRLSAAFVVTVSIGALGCHKTQAGTGSSCEPPDCHANPPPQPTPTVNANPPVLDAGTPPDSPTISRNPPPPSFDAGSRRIIANPPPLRMDAGLLP